MSDQQPPPRIAAAIVAAMQAVTKIGKRGQNQEQNFRYRKYDDIITAAHDALVEAGLVILPNIAEMKQRERDVVTKHGNNRTVTTTIVAVDYQLICAEDASSHTIRYYGEASDYGDKSLGKACSYAEKMMLISVLKIPVDTDDMDPDQHSHADDAPASRPAHKAREPRGRSNAARKAANRPKAADAPAPPPPPAESDDVLHADIIERLGVLSDDPEAEGGQAILEEIWGDVERARLERNAWAVEDYNALKAHVREISGRIQAADKARADAANARLTVTRPDPGEVDPWSSDPREAAEARAAIDAAEGRTPAVFNGPGNQRRNPDTLIDTPEPAPSHGNPDARA